MKRCLPTVLLLAAAVGCGGDPLPPPADAAVAARAYQARLEEDPEDPVLRYDLGTALLRLERFDAARPHLEAASRIGAPDVRQAAYYNLGNSDLEPSFAGRVAGAERERLVRAIAAYKRALLLDPSDADAKWNLELARRLLRRAPPRPRGGGGGAGAGEDPRSGRQDPRLRPSGGSGPRPPLSPAAAERLLSAAREREVRVQRDVLRKQQPRSSRAH